MPLKQCEMVELIERVIEDIGRAPFAAIRDEILRRLAPADAAEWREFGCELDQLIFDALYPIVEFEWPLFQRATEAALGRAVQIDSTMSDDHEIFVVKQGDHRAERVLWAAVRFAPNELFDDADAFAVFVTEMRTRISEYFISEDEMSERRRLRVRDLNCARHAKLTSSAA